MTQLCAVITGDAQWESTDLVTVQPEDVVKLAEWHGLGSLLLSKLPSHTDVASTVFRLLKEDALRETQKSLTQEDDIRRIAALLDHGNCPFLLIKGAALAYLYYPSPNLRPRVDTDIFVPESHVENAHTALIANGYTCEPLVTPLRQGQYLTTQFVCRIGGRSHATDIDIHWRINNSTALGRLFTFEEINDRAIAVSTLDENISGPGLPHSLLISCLHWVAEPSRKLIWLYDLHLINQYMGDDDWEAVIDACGGKDCAAIVATTLGSASTWFNTRFPRQTLEILSRDIPRYQTGKLDLLSKPQVNHLRSRYVDFLSLNWPERFRFLFTLCFPPTTYVRLENPEVGEPSKLFLFGYYLRRPLRLMFPRH